MQFDYETLIFYIEIKPSELLKFKFKLFQTKRKNIIFDNDQGMRNTIFKLQYPAAYLLIYQTIIS